MKTEFKRIVFTCDKCKGKIIHETDFLSAAEIKSQHRCRSASLTAQCRKTKEDTSGKRKQAV